MIEIEKLTALLGQRFDPDAASELDAAIGLNWGTAELRVAVQDRVLSIFSSTPYAANAPSAECVIYFANFEVAYALLIGSANPIEAFMRGRSTKRWLSAVGLPCPRGIYETTAWLASALFHTRLRAHKVR